MTPRFYTVVSMLLVVVAIWFVATIAHGGMLLTKLDSGGEVLWSMDNEDEQDCEVIELDDLGNVYLGCIEHMHKFDRDGDELWKFGELPVDSLDVDSQGNSYFICGDHFVAKRTTDNQPVWLKLECRVARRFVNKTRRTR